jgi:hypothetical protein
VFNSFVKRDTYLNTVHKTNLSVNFFVEENISKPAALGRNEATSMPTL